MNKPKIIHVMSDGTEKENIEGMVIPLTDDTLPAYMLIAEFCRKEN